MKKTSVFIVYIFFFIHGAFSQKLSPELISTSGSSSVATDMSLDWSIGELTTESVEGKQVLYTQGFHQPILSIKEVTMEKGKLRKVVKVRKSNDFLVYPNPTGGMFTVAFEEALSENMELTLTATSGRMVFKKSLFPGENTTVIDMMSLADGLYVLHVRDSSGFVLKTFNISKNN